MAGHHDQKTFYQKKSGINFWDFERVLDPGIVSVDNNTRAMTSFLSDNN